MQTIKVGGKPGSRRILLTIFATLTACGGGGGSDESSTAPTNPPNLPPLITRLSLRPNAPTATEAIEARFAITDVENDPVTTTWSWFVNDTEVTTASSAILTPGIYRKGDEVRVVLTASDGFSTAQEEATTVIADTPLEIFTDAPTTVTYGSAVTFSAGVTDIDDDPTDQLILTLDYGPTGMSLDPATRLVTWVAELPMFDLTTDVNWRISVNDPLATPLTGVIGVEDPSREMVMMRHGFEIPLHDGLETGDFDRDGVDELLILSERSLHQVEADGSGGYRISWMYPFAMQTSSANYLAGDSLAAGDIDGDGRPEVFVAAGDSISTLDGMTRRVRDRVEFESEEGCFELELADLDDNGTQEIVCMGHLTSDADLEMVTILATDPLSVVWRLPDSDYGTSLALGNVDGDGALEIVTSAGYVIDGADFTIEWQHSGGFGRLVDVGDIDGDGIAEIVGADTLLLSAFDATTQDVVWSEPQDRVAEIRILDTIDDEIPEIVVSGGALGNAITVYQYDTLSGSPEVALELTGTTADSRTFGAGDFDGDGALEIVFDTGGGSTAPDALMIAGLGPPLSIEWTHSDPIQLTGPFHGGTLAGSPANQATPVPLFLTSRTDSGSKGARLVGMDPSSGDVTVSAVLGSSLNRYLVPVTVVDYDNDGTDEAFVGTASTGSRPYATVYDFFGGTADWIVDQASYDAVAVTHADMTGDDRDEMITISTDGKVYVFDSFNRNLLWEGPNLEGSDLEPGLDVLATDLNKDDVADVLAVTGSMVVSFENTMGGSSFTETGRYLPSQQILDAIVSDLDGDGVNDVILMIQLGSGPDYRVEVQRLDLALGFIDAFVYPETAYAMAAAWPEGPGRKSLMFGIGDSQSGPAHITAVDTVLGAELWRSPPLLGPISRNSMHVVSIGGTKRISIGTEAGMYLTQ